MNFANKQLNGKNLYKQFYRWEPILFFIIALYNLLPVFGVSYFLTGDGPSHLYNAHLIKQLIANSDGLVSNYFCIHTWFIPNLGGHLFLTLALYFFDPSMAERLLYATSIIGFIAGFRYYLRSINPNLSWVAWFGLFLVHNFSFYIGFQSFSLALGLLLFIIGAWHRNILFSKWSNTICSALAFTALALCHVVPFGVMLLYISLAEIIAFFQSRTINLKRLFFIAMACMPACIFVIHYLLNAPQEKPGPMPEFEDSLNKLLAGTTLITVDLSERIYSRPFQIILSICLIPYFVSFKKLKNVLIPFVSLLILLGLYFLLPDSMGTGSFMSVRLMLFVYIFASVLAGAFPGNEKAAPAIVAVLGLLNIFQVWYHYETAQKLSNDAAVVISVNEHIKRNTLMLPLNYSHHWLHYNIALYPGAYRKVVILDNYEASKAAFPIAWKGDMNPHLRLGNFGYTSRPLFHLEPYEHETGARLDYVLRYGINAEIIDENTLSTNRELKASFNLILHNEQQMLELWERK